MVSEDKKEHCTFKDNVLHCTACDAKKTLKLPLEVRDFTLKCKQFINAHEKCATGEKK
jgi:hypothetical protein